MADTRKSTDSTSGRRAAGRPPRHIARAIDERLLDAARALFCQKGISNTSMEEVAERTGIAKQTIYRRYPGKAALIDAVVNRDLDRMLAASTASAPSPLERLRKTALQRFHFSLEPENLLFVGFLMAEAAYSDSLRDKFQEWSKRVRAPVADLVEQAQAAGELRASDPAVTARLLGDLLNSASEPARLSMPDAFDGLPPDIWFEHRWQAFLRLESPQ